jgi:hypothetical protein
MSSIQDRLKIARPTLSEGSLKTYTSIITSLGRQMKKDYGTPDAVIADYGAILEHLKDVPPKNRKTRLASLVVFISATEGNEEAIEAFRKVMMGDKEVAEEETKEQQLTERQKEGWIPWTEVLERYRTLEKDTKRLWKKPSLDKHEFHQLQTYVLLSCLVLLDGPRRSMDWVEFRLRNADKEKENYMTYEKRKPIIVFNRYKTDGVYGSQKVEASALAPILRKWMEKNPHDHLLMNYHQTGPMTQSQITTTLHEFFGKPISTTLLRHIFLSHFHQNTPALKEMEKVAHTMAHSVRQGMEYVKKEPVPEPVPAPEPPKRLKVKRPKLAKPIVV